MKKVFSFFGNRKKSKEKNNKKSSKVQDIDSRCVSTSILKESQEFKILFKKSENLLSGKYFSVLKGDGIEFVDVREYVAGDDIRKIDWKVSAREQKTFVKEFHEEKELSHFVLLDISASSFNKLEEMKVLASSLLLSSFRMQDSFTIVFFAKDFMYTLPVLKGKRHLMRCIYEISKIEFKGKGDFENVMYFLLNKINRKSLVSIVSDEMEFSRKDLKLLKTLKVKNEVMFFNVYNSTERDLDQGMDVFEDIETGEEFIYDLDAKELADYQNLYDKTIEEFVSTLKRIGVRVYSLDAKNSMTVELKRNYEKL